MRGGLRVLSGTEVVNILIGFGFVVTTGRQHLQLRRVGPNGDETLVVPNHASLAKGPLRAIYSQASRYIPQVDLHTHFYNE